MGECPVAGDKSPYPGGDSPETSGSSRSTGRGRRGEEDEAIVALTVSVATEQDGGASHQEGGFSAKGGEQLGRSGAEGREETAEAGKSATGFAGEDRGGAEGLEARCADGRTREREGAKGSERPRSFGLNLTSTTGLQEAQGNVKRSEVP